VDHVIRGDPAEHHVQLRKAEDEPVGLVDQHHARVLTELLRQQGRQFQAGEAGPKDHNPHPAA